MKFNLGKFLAVVSQIGPVILAATPGAEKFGPIVGEVVGAIKAAEQIKGATGPEKKAHVLAIAKAAVNAANTTGKVKIDPATVDQVVGAGVDTVIGTIGLIEGAHDQTGILPADPDPAATAAHTAGSAGSVPGVDAAAKSSDLGDGHATHGHGSGDNIK
jgi:hypothetical protein